MKRLAFLPLVALAFLTACGDQATQPLEPDATAALSTGELASDATITSPSDGEVVYSNTLELVASEDIDDRTLRWRIRDVACEDDTQSAGDNVLGEDVAPYDGELDTEVDLTGLDAGHYCFVYNTHWDTGGNDDGEGSRVLHDFYIVDHYVKAGGVVTMEERTRVGNGTHAMEGWVADAGTAGLLGEIEVNYRGLRDTCTFSPTSLSLDTNLPGTGTRATLETDVSDCAMDPSSATFFVGESDEWDRGGIVVRPSGSTGDQDYLIDNTPGSTGGASWVPLTHGNAYIISR